MKLAELREVVRGTVRGDSAEVSVLDEASAAAFARWQAEHSGDPATYEPPASPSAFYWIVSDSARTDEEV